jgi:signal transduction histidine kinase
MQWQHFVRLASRRWAAGGAALLAFVGLLLGATLLAPVARAAQRLEPSTVEVQSSPAEDPAELGDGWQAGALPDNWARSHPGLRGPHAWYRIGFELPARAPGSGSWALYIPYLYDGGRFWLNGHPLAAIAQTTSETHVRWERPHLIAMPDSQLRVGHNELLLRAVVTDPGAGLRLQRMTIGPTEELLPLYDRRMFWVRTMPQAAVVTCLVVGCFVLFVWWRRRSELLYGLFGLAAILWSIRTLTFVIEVMPEPWWPWWRALYHAATGGFIVALALFAIRFAGLRLPRLERGLALYWALGPLAMLFSGGRLDSWVGFAWTGGMIPVGLSIVGFSAYGAWKLRSGSAYALVLAEAIAASAGIHDYLVAWDGAFRLPEFTREWMAHRIFLLHHGANLLLLVMVGILTLRFVRALDSTEELNRSLEARVAEREHELEARHARLRELEREQAVLDERQRIVQDLHDGLGSQLFTALSRAERGGLDAQELAQVLRECIADMRLVFDATAPEAREPAAVLRDFVARWELLLREAGVRLTAHIELPAGAALPPTTVVQLLRVMQEALTNALKHAAASEVRVGLERVGDALELTIADDGRGFAVDSLQPGRGLLSMRRRARTLGARLELSSGAGGTALALRLPRGGDAG